MSELSQPIPASADAVVITGAGLVTPMGLSRAQTWAGLLEGRNAMGPMPAMESPVPAGQNGGQAPDLPPDFAPGLTREARYLSWTIREALGESGGGGALPYPPARRAAFVGTTLHGMRSAGAYLRDGDLSHLREFLASRTLASALAGADVASLAATTCSACSSSLGSVALGVGWLRDRRADLVIAGGYDPISEYVFGGFSSLRLVAPGPLRPFARGRQGMKLAEGYAIVILERAADALARGARPLATIAGWGESADAHHLTQPHPQGAGAARAIEQALASARLDPADIDLIAAHATGTPDNDAGEYAAFLRVFGDRLGQTPVVAFKSHLGHTLGAAGAVELILSAMALEAQIVPACANVKDADIEFPGLRVATGPPRAGRVRHTLNTSLGFGGANACVILAPPPDAFNVGSASRTIGTIVETTVHNADPANSNAPDPTTSFGSPAPAERSAMNSRREVLITGVGVAFPRLVGADAALARVAEAGGRAPAWSGGVAARVDEAEIAHLLSARRVRRMSDYVKLTLAAATLACRDAGVVDLPDFFDRCSAVLGSTHGSANYSADFYRQIVEQGIGAANPMLFAEAVPNAGAAQLSLMLALKGACQTVIGSRTAGLDAIALAASRIAAGIWDRALVGAGEEYSELVCRAYGQCGSAGAAAGCAPFAGEAGFVAGAGSAMLVLESRASFDRRGGQRPRGRITASASASARGPSDRAAQAASDVLAGLGGPAAIVSSACGTWVDRAEAAAIVRSPGAVLVTSLYGHVAETFSATPVAAVAIALLSGKLPTLLGAGWTDPAVAPARGDEPADDFAVICTDLTGSVSGVRIGSHAV